MKYLDNIYTWFIVFSISVLGLFIYSFSQVDLNLTLSSNQYYQLFQASLTQVGYFNRPTSVLIYIVLVVSLFMSYISLIYRSNLSKTKLSNVVKVALIGSIILTLSYPAFSYDIFNYIFDARILVEHNNNPYLHTALDFPDDLWTRFMRWTHRTYPYGPTWLVVTVPFYILGQGKFLLTLLSFKLIGFLSYLLGGLGIYLTLKKHSPKDVKLALILYLFNPIILIEGLISAHLDMAMAGIMLFGIGLYASERRWHGWLGLLFSIGIKYVSGAVTPLLFLFHQKKISFDTMVIGSVLLSYILTAIVVSQRELLPWYFIVPFSLTCLVPRKKTLLKLMLALTPALLVRYAPFIYVGSYPSEVYLARNILTAVIFCLVLLVSVKIEFTQKK